MSKKENKELAKKRRLEERKAAQRKALFTKIGIAAAVVCVIAVIIGAAAISSKKSDTSDQKEESTTESTETTDTSGTDTTSEVQTEQPELDTTEGREVKTGDTVAIDYVGKKDGVAFDGGTGSYDLTIGSHAFIEGFEDGLIGKKVGETVVLNLTFPEDYQAADLAGKDVVFTVTINGIYK